MIDLKSIQTKVAKTGDTMTGDLKILGDLYHHKKPDVPSQNYMIEHGWTNQTSASTRAWKAIVWSPKLGLFCAVADGGTVDGQVMTSPDGITWTSRTSASLVGWRAMAWSPELGLFCAVARNGTVDNQVMTSPDGITWTNRTSASLVDRRAITWSPELGLFCAVARDGTVDDGVMTSPDGITWTSRTSASLQYWREITWSPELGLFCAVASDGTVDNQVMTSPDGITWTSRTSASLQSWYSVTWSPELGLFCAVSYTGYAMTSPDGITWTSRTSAALVGWEAIVWSPELGLFCAVANGGTVDNQVMTSPDGITWTSRTSASGTGWRSIEWSPELGLFCTLSDQSSAGGQAITSLSRKYSTVTSIGALIGGAADATPNDTDFVATSLTAAGVLKKITWTNVKVFFKTYFDTLYHEVDTEYGEAFIYNNAVASVIETANNPTGLYTAIETGVINGFTFHTGHTLVIQSYQDGTTPTTQTRVNSSDHTLVNGEVITIRGSSVAGYNGIHTVSNVAVGYFDIDEAWVSDGGASDWIHPASLIVVAGSAGIYAASWQMSTSAAAAQKLIWLMNINATPQTKTAAAREYPINDVGSVSSSGILTLVEGDVVWLSVEADGTSNITNINGNFNIHRL